MCAIPQFLVKTLAEIHAMGVLDGTATMEPMLFYLEADNINILTEKCAYRWESAYNGKIIGGSLVRDVLTCTWASRKGLRRSEIGSIMRLAPAQITPLLLSVTAFLTTETGHFNFQSHCPTQLVEDICQPLMLSLRCTSWKSIWPIFSKPPIIQPKSGE